MESRIRDLLKGKSVPFAPRMILSESGAELTLEEGRNYRSSFLLSAETDERLEVYACTDHFRIKTDKERYIGRTIHVSYSIDTGGCRPGDKIEGEIKLFTSHGKFVYQIRAKIAKQSPIPDMPEIRSLNDFVSLAMENYREAFGIFKSGRLESLCTGEDARLAPLYRGLIRNPVTHQRMEEFMVAAGKKEQVQIRADKKGKIRYYLDTSQKDVIYLYKNTWGSLEVDVKTEGDFIRCEQSTIRDNDFVGSVFGLDFILDKNKVSGTSGKGRIILTTSYEKIVLEIEAFVEPDIVPEQYIARQKSLIGLYKDYLDMRAKKVDYRTWYEKAKEDVAEYDEAYPDHYAFFARAFLYYCEEENRRLKDLLMEVYKGNIDLKQSWEIASYMYLSKAAGMVPEDERDISKQLYQCYKTDPKVYLPLEIFFMDRNSTDQLQDQAFEMIEMEKAFEKGCNSRLMLIRASEILRKDEAILRHLSPFMIRVLSYLLKEGKLTHGLYVRAAYMTAGARNFSKELYKILEKGYEEYPDPEILEAICKYISLDDPANGKYYKWYEMAVAEGLQITKLNEYYMYSRPESEGYIFPKSVRHYFLYSSVLGHSRRAYLYAGIVTRKKDAPICFGEYEPTIRHFAFESLRQGMINENLAVLYKEFCMDSKDPQIIANLAKLIFTCKFSCSSSLRRVIINHRYLEDETALDLKDGEAYPRIYDEDFSVVLEDGGKNRFAANIPYTLERLFDPEKYIRELIRMGVDSQGLRYSLLARGRKRIRVTPDNRRLFCKAEQDPEFNEEARNDLRSKLLEFYHKNLFRDEILKEAVKINDRAYARVDLNRTLEILTAAQEYERAYALIGELGFEKTERGILLQIADAMIEQKRGREEAKLVDLSLYLFRHDIFDARTISYMCDYAFVDVAEADAIWQIARKTAKDTTELEERTLLFSVYSYEMSPNIQEIFSSYQKHFGKSAIRKAYLVFLAIYYLYGRLTISEDNGESLMEYMQDFDNYGKICMLAWLKYQSEKMTYSDDEERLIRKLLDRCDSFGIRMRFFTDLPESFTEKLLLEGKVYIEKIMNPGTEIMFCYRIISNAQKEDTEFRKEPFREDLAGIHVREFILFEGEKLEYFYLEKGRSATEVRTLEAPKERKSGSSRYHLLSGICAHLEDDDPEIQKALLREYQEKDVYVKKMFEPA